MAIWGVIGNNSDTKYQKLEEAWNVLIQKSGIESKELVKSNNDRNISIGWTEPLTKFYEKDDTWIYGPFLKGDNVEIRDIPRIIEDPELIFSDSFIDGYFLHLIHDKSNNLLEIRTDNSGDHAPYFIKIDNHFYFSSNLIHLAIALKLKLDDRYIFYFMQNGVIPSRNSLIKNVLRMAGSSRLIVNIDNSEYKESCYLDYRHFEKNFTIDDTIKSLETSFKRIITPYLSPGTNPIVDLTVGIDSRLIASYANSYASTSVTYTTGLDEVDKSMEISSHFNNMKEHINQNLFEERFNAEYANKYVNAFILANGGIDLRFSIMAAWRAREIFSNYSSRFCGIMGEVIRDFTFIHEIPRLTLGLNSTVNNHLKYRMLITELPPHLWKNYIEAEKLFKDEIELQLSMFPLVSNSDLNDLIYNNFHMTTRDSTLVSLSERLYPYQYVTPYAYNSIIAIIRRTIPKNRLFSNLPRELLYRLDPELCNIPITLGHKLHPFSGKHRLSSALDIIFQYTSRAFSKIARLYSLKKRGSQFESRFSKLPASNQSEYLDNIINDIVKKEANPHLVELANHDEFLKIVEKKELDIPISKIENVAVDRYATMTRLANLLESN